jgi:hypothetical protein
MSSSGATRMRMRARAIVSCLSIIGSAKASKRQAYLPIRFFGQSPAQIAGTSSGQGAASTLPTGHVERVNAVRPHVAEARAAAAPGIDPWIKQEISS